MNSGYCTPGSATFSEWLPYPARNIYSPCWPSPRCCPDRNRRRPRTGCSRSQMSSTAPISISHAGLRTTLGGTRATANYRPGHRRPSRFAQVSCTSLHQVTPPRLTAGTINPASSPRSGPFRNSTGGLKCVSGSRRAVASGLASGFRRFPERASKPLTSFSPRVGSPQESPSPTTGGRSRPSARSAIRSPALTLRAASTPSRSSGNATGYRGRSMVRNAFDPSTACRSNRCFYCSIWQSAATWHTPRMQQRDSPLPSTSTTFASTGGSDS